MTPLGKGRLFLPRSTNKLGITLNLKAPRGVGLIKELITEVDAVVEKTRASASAQNPSKP